MVAVSGVRRTPPPRVPADESHGSVSGKTGVRMISVCRVLGSRENLACFRCDFPV